MCEEKNICNPCAGRSLSHGAVQDRREEHEGAACHGGDDGDLEFVADGLSGCCDGFSLRVALVACRFVGRFLGVLWFAGRVSCGWAWEFLEPCVCVLVRWCRRSVADGDGVFGCGCGWLWSQWDGLSSCDVVTACVLSGAACAPASDWYV